MSVASTSRPWLALLSSGLLHVGLAAVLVLASSTAGGSAGDGGTAAGSSRSGVISLRGDQKARPAGRDALFEILGAGDAFAVRLTSSAGDSAVGLAWVSPSRGMWLALDGVTFHASETMQVWQDLDDGSRVPLAAVTLDSDGSGRIVAIWDVGVVNGSDRPVVLEVTSRRGFWPFVRELVVLRGRSRPRQDQTAKDVNSRSVRRFVPFS